MRSRALKLRITIPSLFLVVFITLGPLTTSARGTERSSSTDVSWIYPQPSAVDQFSSKETKRFDRAWKDFTEGDIKKAQEDWSSLLNKHPNSPRLLTALGYIDFVQRQPDSAVAKLEAAFHSDPKYVLPLQVLARYFTAQKNYEKAFSHLAKLAELRPDDPQVRSDLESTRLLVTEKFIADAHTARAKGNWQEAESNYLRAMTAAPELGTLPRELGDIYVYEGKMKEAESSFAKAIRLDPTDIDAKKKLAEALLKTNQRDKAEKLLKELADQNAQDEEIRSMLEKILAHSDPLDEVLAEVRQRAQVSRGDFGAMIVVRFSFLKEFLTTPPPILTDLGTHWGRKYLPLVAGLDLIPPLPNHQFMPNAMLRRYEIATAIDRLLVLVNRQPNFTAPQKKIADVPKTNPYREAIERVVSLGLMEVDSNNRFLPQSGVSGTEVMKILDAVENFLH